MPPPRLRRIDWPREPHSRVTDQIWPFPRGGVKRPVRFVQRRFADGRPSRGSRAAGAGRKWPGSFRRPHDERGRDVSIGHSSSYEDHALSCLLIRSTAGRPGNDVSTQQGHASDCKRIAIAASLFCLPTCQAETDAHPRPLFRQERSRNAGKPDHLRPAGTRNRGRGASCAPSLSRQEAWRKP